MSDIMSDAIIVGAGISGVTYAHYAARSGKKVSLLEKRDSAGGCIYTTKLCDDFFTETGAHTFYPSYATIIEMIRALGLEGDILPQRKQGYKMLVNGKIVSLFSQISLPRFLLGTFLMGGDKSGKTVEEFYSHVFGAKNFEKLMHPVTSAVICQDSALFAADLLLKRRSKDKSLPASFSMKDGLGGFIAAAAKTAGVSLSLSTTVLSVKKKDGNWLVKTDKGEFSAPRLVMATEAPQAAALMASTSPALADHLKKLHMVSSTAFSVATEAENMPLKPFSYLIAADAACRSVVSRDVLPDRKYRGFTAHFKLPDFDTELPALYEVLKIRDTAALKTFKHTFALPRLGVEHWQWLKTLNEITAGIEGFDLLGNFYGGLALEDCALRAKAIIC